MIVRLLRRLGLVPPAEAPVLSARAHARLLDITFERMMYSINVIPFVGVPFVIWLYLRHEEWRWLLGWTLAYGLAALWARWLRQRFRVERTTSEDDEANIQRWLPLTQRIALAHGVALSLGSVLTLGEGGFEYALLISLAAILAANATHQTPLLGVFLRCFFACWSVVLVTMPWRLPTVWFYVLPLALLYTVAICRHAVVANQFFHQQVRLEEDGIRLAERYRAAKEEAEAALQAKNQFLSTASHDLRQPVHAMGLLAEAIAVRNRDPALEQALDDMRLGVQALNFMCNALLDLSRIESGAVQAHPQSVPLGPLLHEVAALFLPQARARGLDMRVRVPQGEPAVWADPVLLRQSFINLVHNALRYTVHGGVLLAARRAGTGWRVEVWDTGMGVADQEQQLIFSPFYRPEHAWRVDSTGHGLGLAVVARCAELMGTGYGITSRLGHGSRFWLRLNAAVADAGTAMHHRPPDPAATHATKHVLRGCCLIVEDDPRVASAWHGLLQAWGMEVRCVDAAQPALATLDAGFVPDAILCDQRLRSGESGFDVLRTLLERCPAASGAMVSGEFDAPELRQAEAEGYLVLRKPVDTATLHTLLTTWLINAR